MIYNITNELVSVITPAGDALYLYRENREDEYQEAVKTLLDASISVSDKEAIIRTLIDRATTINDTFYIKDGFEVRDGRIVINGTPYDIPGLGDKLFEMAKNRENQEAYVNFAMRLIKNPSATSVRSLFEFIINNDIPITDTGMIVAFKVVDRNLFDHHTHTIKNTPGSTIKMPRNLVLDDPLQACGPGLHVCAKGYIPTFFTENDSNIVVTIIDPEHVVSVPVDHDFEKMRTCQYFVLGVIDKSKVDKIAAKDVWNTYDLEVLVNGKQDVRSVDDMSAQELKRFVEEHGATKAAKMLGIPRSTLYNIRARRGIIE